MKLFTRHWIRLCLLFSACLLLVTAVPVSAQKVSIDFDDYHGYTGTVDYLNKVARAYPNITELLEIGKSTMDRPIYVLVISNMRTGTTIDKHVELRNMRKENVQNVTPMKSYHGKPGHWIDGGTHGNEYTGTEVCLYIIDKLLTGYDSDSGIKQLIDDNAFYVCPIVNPDGVYNSAEGGISQRQNSMMKDDDNDGRINEDGPDDVNGDGFITSFRYKDPEGRYVAYDKDPRVMIRLGRGEETTKERWSVIREDKDNDGDGKYGEDPERGIDVNRNFPEGWYRDDNSVGGSGTYPSSAPESHAILEFFTNNTNIFMVQSYHTSGGFTYRPYARWSDNKIEKRDLYVYDNIMGKKYLELIGAEVPEAWKESNGNGVQQRQARRTRTERAETMPRGWRHPYSDEQDRPYGFGIFLDWAFGQFGTYSMSTELWSWRNDTKGIPGFNGEDDRGLWESSYINYQESQFGGKRFIQWQKYTHPEYGEGEIGGWVSRYGTSNAIPGESLIGVCDTHWQFELFKANLLPKVEIAEAKAEILYTTNSATEAEAAQRGDTVTIRKGRNTGPYKVVRVTATIKNTGQLPTHIARGSELAGNREDAVWLLGDRDNITYLQGQPFMQLGVLDGTLELPDVKPTPTRTRRYRRFSLPTIPSSELPEKTGSEREVEWLVAVKDNTPLKIVVTSQKGGTKVKELSIK